MNSSRLKNLLKKVGIFYQLFNSPPHQNFGVGVYIFKNMFEKKNSNLFPPKKKNTTEKPPTEATPLESMEHAESPVSPEAINRLKSEKLAGIEYFYTNYQGNKFDNIPPTVDRVDLNPRNPRELIVKIKDGKVMDIRGFGERMLDPEKRKNLIERIENKLKK